MRLGVRAHDFGKLPVEELAERIAGKGFSCVQLAPPKAITGFDPDLGRLSPGFACHVKEAFQRHHLQIAVLGCYINLADPDVRQRQRQLDRFKEYLRHARDFGCSVVGTETGSVNPDFSFHPANRSEEAFQIVLGSVRELVEEAERFGVGVGIEGVERYVISDPPRIRRLIDGIGSNNLQIIFDPVNLLSVENYRRQDAIIKESFELFGDRIAILHAKDFVVDGGSLRSVLSGRGMLHYGLLMDLIKARKPDISILMEDTDPETVEDGVRFLRGFFPV
ncbi:MAG: sugar phosphate isomerase/epimerase [Opitutaceae bacterium]|jgi:sugar phosphate isomerase/epimerase